MDENSNSLDPEILKEFTAECRVLLSELKPVVVAMGRASEAFPSKELEEFAQKIDRIMGSAKTMVDFDPWNQGLHLMGKLAEYCKQTGYEAAKRKDAQTASLCAQFCSDSCDMLHQILDHLASPSKISKIAVAVDQFEGRHKLLQDKLKSS